MAKAKPLFSKAERKAQADTMAAIERKCSDRTDAAHKKRGIKSPSDDPAGYEEWNKEWNGAWSDYYREKAAHESAVLTETIQRIKARSGEFLDGLLLCAANRDENHTSFEDAFAKSGDATYRAALAAADTPENRLALHTAMKSLTEIPPSYGTTAFVRFLRGVGKQKGSKCYGAGAFGTGSGWTQNQVRALSRLLTDSQYYVGLMTYANVQKEIYEAEVEAQEKDEDSGIPYKAQFCGTRAIRDKEFLNELCAVLEKKGLAASLSPAPGAKGKKKK